MVEAQQRSPEAASAGTHRDDEEPAGEVIVLGGRPTQARDERVVNGVEGAVGVAKHSEQRAIHPRELESVELLPTFRADRGRHRQ